jgi:nickel-dependent lactate racemase
MSRAPKPLTESEVRDILASGLERAVRDDERVLVIIPDGTRTAPIPLLFRLFHELLGERTAALDFLVALGTHPPMSEEALNRLVGITPEERTSTYASTRIFNHRWDREGTFVKLGTIPAAELAEVSAGRLAQDVDVTINRLILDYDRLIICGPVFPHEVVGFSGGTKYFFPGIAGAEVINVTHWLGALLTCREIIGTHPTPVRALIDRAAALVPTPWLTCNLVVAGGDLVGLAVGPYAEAWPEAVALSRQLHIRYVERPFRRVLSIMPEMYDDLWTAAKGMYKLEPVVADGGEVVIYAPHIDEISYTHGAVLDEVGYHVRDYFVAQWERFKHHPWGVLAHSTHLRGAGTYDAGTGGERPRIEVTLATRIPPERCARVNLGYLDPASVDLRAWEKREAEGLLVVPHAGELLFRLKEE